MDHLVWCIIPLGWMIGKFKTGQLLLMVLSNVSLTTSSGIIGSMRGTMKMTEEQIKILRLAIQKEIEYASIDGFEHGAWGWAEKDADKLWKEFQDQFVHQKTLRKRLSMLSQVMVRQFCISLGMVFPYKLDMGQL